MANIDRRTILLILAGFFLGILVLTAIDNQDTILPTKKSNDQWGRITTHIVEQNCLDQAKKVAVAEGYSESFVLSCSCLNVQSEVLKTYDCSINTIDVVHAARKVLVHCYKTNGQCTIASEQGLQTYNMSELDKYLIK